MSHHHSNRSGIRELYTPSCIYALKRGKINLFLAIFTGFYVVQYREQIKENIMLSPMERVNKYYDGLKNGTLDSLEPLLPLFTMEGNPLSLAGREPTIPIFKLSRPKRMTLMAGRQVSKSYTLSELAILMTGLSAGFHTAIIEPRHVQKKRLNSQIIAPLLRDCLVRDLLIEKKNVDTLDLKTFKSGGQLILINGFLTPDGARGTSGASMVQIDESTLWSTEVVVYDFTLKKYKNKKICAILAGDVLTSFKDGAILYSVAVRDASFHGVRGCYKVSTASGRSITCTMDHLLPTNLGKKRLEEIVNYVGQGEIGEVPDSSCGSRDEYQCRAYSGGAQDVRNSTECYNGLGSWGRLCSETSISNSEQPYSLEPLVETSRVRFSQVPAIERVRYTRTREEREQRVRGLLVSTDPEKFKHISLVVRPDTSSWLVCESSNTHFPVPDNTPDSSGMVVHGRRLETDRLEHREYSDERLLLRGRGLTQSLDEGHVGSDCKCDRSKAQFNGEDRVCYQPSEECVCEDRGNDRALCTGLYEVQDRDSDSGVCAVREDYAEGTRTVLLPRLRPGAEEDKAARVSGEDKRAAQGTLKAVESSQQGEDKRAGTRSVYQNDARAEGATCRVREDVQREEQREDKCTEKGLESSNATGCGIPCEEGSGRQSLQRAFETGSCEVCCLYEEEVGVQENKKFGPGSTSDGDGSAESSKSCCECRSGEESSAVSKGQGECKETPGENDTRGVSGVQKEGLRAEQAVQGEAQAGSREVSCTESEASSVPQGEVCTAHARGKRQNQCTKKRASETESRERGASVWSMAEEERRSSSCCGGHSNRATLIEPIEADFFYDPIVSIEYVGDDAVYDIEVEGTHNYILSNGICSYNCQDIPNSFIPIFEAMTDAKVDTGFRIRSGTAKTSDGTLSLSFDDSSQGHWCIKCSCGKYNIAAMDEQLLQMVGEKGCSCAWCKKQLDVVTGFYLHKYPSRIYTHVGYHMPQIVFPFHNTKGGWTEILHKKASNSRTAFLNEVLGVPDDDSVRLLSKADLLKARNNVRTKERAAELANNYHLRVLGVDWGGGGGGDSATGIAVIAKNHNAKHYECLWMCRLPQGLTPEQEADVVARFANEFRVDFIAHDYTGAGFVRESLFLQKHEGWRDYIYPISYTYKPTADLVTPSSSGSRASYTVDKTKSLLLTINCIKHGALSIPWFDDKDNTACQLDFLSIIEHQQKVGEGDAGGKNSVLRASDVFLLDKVAGKKDDAAQAVNIGLIAACNILGYYPVFTFDSKYNITAEQYELLTGDKV